MLTKEELYKKVIKKFEKKLSIDFWFEVLYLAYKEEKLTEKEVFGLLKDVNENQT